MFFNSWEAVFRLIVIAPLTYIALIAVLRISGKRTLSKMNMFDFVITVALGSTFATIILSKNIALAEGVTGIVMLVLLQYIVSWVSARSDKFRELVKGEPTLLLHRGEFLSGAMLRERVTKEEVYSAIRDAGIAQVDKVGAVVLETDGSFTTIPSFEEADAAALTHVANRP